MKSVMKLFSLINSRPQSAASTPCKSNGRFVYRAGRLATSSQKTHCDGFLYSSGQPVEDDHQLDRYALDLRDGLANLAQLREHREVLGVEHLAVVRAVALPGTSRR